MKRRFFIGTGLAAGGSLFLGGLPLISETQKRLIVCVSGIRKSDAVQLGWYKSENEAGVRINARGRQIGRDILPLRNTRSLLFSDKNNHVDKLSGLLSQLQWKEADSDSRLLRQRCYEQPLVLNSEAQKLFYFDGLEVGHSSVDAYFLSLKNAENWVQATLREHINRYGEKATYVICSEMCRDEAPTEDGGAFHHNSEESAYGFISSFGV